MKRLVKIIAILIIALVILFGSIPSIGAVESGALENTIIPPEGRLFMPDHPATRATVAMVIYNISGSASIRSSAGVRSSASIPGSAGVRTADTNGGLSTQAAPRSFSDISGDDQYYMPVTYCAQKGYVNGYPDGTFKPEGQITRAEICGILARFLSLKEVGKHTLPADVPAGHWASGSIAAIISNGIMSGYEDKSFKPENKLTRAELAVIIVNAKHPSQPGHVIEFGDVPKTHWAYNYVACVSTPDQSAPVPSASAQNSPGTSASAQNAPGTSDTVPNTKGSSDSVQSTPAQSVPSLFAFDQSRFETEVAQMINEERIKAGVPELRLDPLLSETARIKAQDMIDNNYFGHKSPKWGYPDAMMKSFGIVFNYNGENIAYGAVLPDEVVEDWVYSPAHYDNLLSKNYKRTGVGCAKNKDGAIYWVQMFCD